MRDRAVLSILFAMSVIGCSSTAHAAGPFGSIRIAGWSGGAFTDDASGSFTHCGAHASYKNGTTLLVGQGTNGWLLGFAGPGWKIAKGESFPMDVTFDGQAQFHLFATGLSEGLAVALLPSQTMEQFRKAHLMSAFGKGQAFQFELAGTGQLLPTIANCYTKSKAAGVASAGDFTVPVVKPVSSPKPDLPKSAAATATTSSVSKPGKLIDVTGTGFVVSTGGHVVTNHHVIDVCVGDIQGKLAGGAAMNLRTVSVDEANDLALLQASAPVTASASIRGAAIRSGDAVIAIGYPFHGLLTSDFTVTTGIVSSLSGLLNDTRRLQISAPVQSGNSGGPLLDTSGNVIGVVTSKLNGLKFAKLTGDLPENINFAIKTGALRDFLDNSVVPYKLAEPGGELKTTDVASGARGYTMLISCSATAKE
jgi:S1-C subfamily serine protease